MPERNGLITTAELAAILEQPDLRLFDGTTYLEYQPAGSDIPYIAVPGRHTFEAAHIPGADFPIGLPRFLRNGNDTSAWRSE
jgi:thiosulfate/3-mercaptopyruvate sulfurtransferase